MCTSMLMFLHHDTVLTILHKLNVWYLCKVVLISFKALHSLCTSVPNTLEQGRVKHTGIRTSLLFDVCSTLNCAITMQLCRRWLRWASLHTRGAQGLSPGDDVGGCSPSRSPPSRPPPPRTWASPLRHLLPASLPARIPSVLGNYCPASNSIWHPRVVKWGKSRAIYVAAS